MRKKEKIDVKDKLLEFEGEASILPLYISPNELEPATEVIVCSVISGGANYENEMPRELTLIRKMLDGREHTANYIQKTKEK